MATFIQRRFLDVDDSVPFDGVLRKIAFDFIAFKCFLSA